METITIESSAYQEVIGKIDEIYLFIQNLSNPDLKDIDGWVDNYEVCEYLKISNRTLQRLRSNRQINFSIIRKRLITGCQNLNGY